jgi:hypothetical protein
MPPADADIEDRLLTEATARVTWGDFPEDVAAHLVGQGVDAWQADKLVERLVAERSREVRRRSFIKLAAGIPMTLVAVGVLYWYFKERMSPLRNYGLGRLLAGGALFMGLGGLAAIWRGVWGLAMPAAEELTDVEESDDPQDGLPPYVGR